MKTRFFGAMALAMAIFAMTACQKDKADDTWKQLPLEQISVESGNAKISVNEVSCTYGNVQMVADGEDSGTLTLIGIVPGYADLKVNVDLAKKSDDSFAFKGTTIVSTPPSIAATLRSTGGYPCYAVDVDGSITLEGVVNVSVATRVQGDVASLTGIWNIVRKCKYIEDAGPDPADRTPVQITWKMAEGVGESLKPFISLANLLGSSILAEVFDQVTFDETGNILARYWPDLEVGEDPAGILSFVPEPKDGYYDFTTKKHAEWLESPKANLAFWYATGNSLYVVPNVAAIMDAADAETVRSDSDASGIDISSIKEILAQLKVFGVDVDALNAELEKILLRGVELKYSVSADRESLRIYVDKALCDPIVEALLPVLPTLDTLLEQLVQDGNETAQTIISILPILGLEKPSDIAALWKATTMFEIALNFTKA